MTTRIISSAYEAAKDVMSVQDEKPLSGMNWRSLRTHMRRFRDDEGGSMIIFALFLFAMMLMIGGLSVDVMRAEYQRTHLQYTLDRAVLAAASIKQTVPAQDVVNDYFDKAGLGPLAPTVDVDQSLNYRKVSANMATPGHTPRVPTMFLRMNFRKAFGLSGGEGPQYLATPALATAVDGVQKVDVALVLDISGSMDWDSVSGNRKIEDLQDAAKEFVDTLLLNQPEDDTYSISIVPYSTQVNVGEPLLSKYNVTNEHDYSSCADFEDADFQTTTLSTSAPLQRTGYFVPRSYGNYDRPPWRGWRSCYTESSRAILPLSGDVGDLKSYIDNLSPRGWTSTEIGIKWGTSLLDPSARDVVSGLIDDGIVDAKFAGRPFDYSERNAMKVMVVMTDGANTKQFTLDPAVSDGLSPVWWKSASWGDKFWVYNEDRNASKKYRKLYYYSDSGSLKYSARWVTGPQNGAVQLTWQELWNMAPMEFVSKKLFDKAYMDYPAWNSTYWTGFYETVQYSDKDVRMDAMCTAAKQQGILLFTIGFEVEDDNAVKLSHCATTAAHFFRVEGVEISEAFSSIAAQINSLRLIQ